MWERLHALMDRSPSVHDLRVHRLHLLEASRRLAAGVPLDDELAAEMRLAAGCELAAPVVLRKARAAYDGALVLVKGPELAARWPARATRPFADLDLIAGDAPRAQHALLAAGFEEVGDPAAYADIHHLRPLWWPGSPIVVELHSHPKWPEGLRAPATAELLAAAVPSALGLDGVGALPAPQHALLVAAHAWAHEPLARLGHLVDVAVVRAEADRAETAAVARAWGCARLWATTERAVDALLGDGRSSAVAVWARHLRSVRERTVLESHVLRLLAPMWGLPAGPAGRMSLTALLDEPRRARDEAWAAKARRARLAILNAGLARSEHDEALEARVR
jgi:hypothetical protein